MSEKPTGTPADWLAPIDEEIPSGIVVRVLGVLALVTVVSFAAAWGFYLWFARDEAALDPAPSPLIEARQQKIQAAPRMQVNDQQDLAVASVVRLRWRPCWS